MKECTTCKHCYDDTIDVCPVDSSVPIATIAGSTTISGRYILESRLGQGGMGIVFRAKHKFLKSSHAVKIILPSLVDDDSNLLVRFNQEAVLAASIDHPNVIRVTDFGVENDIMPFLVMEFIDGIPLSNYLVEGKPLTIKETSDLFMPAAEGVAEAHSKGIVHRDLKPQNIMVQKNLPLKKAVKVLDFGLAKIKSADSYPSLIQAKTMNIVGSPPYMSPEQWSGEGVDHRTDIYALAVILYQMVTGRLPFQADSMPAMMYQHLTVAPPTAASIGVTLSPEIEAVIQKGLQKDPQNRYDSMVVMLRELSDAFGQENLHALTGAATEYLIPRSSLEPRAPETVEPSKPLSDSQKERFYSYFDSKDMPKAIADPQLAQDFLDAQDRIEFAKTEAVNADQLVQELVEAQKEAEAAQDKAVQAKKQIEDDVRRKVEAEMARLATEDQAKREAEAERLSQEVEARRVAEERANFLAQAALQAQKLAETERKKREEEAQQRELNESVRRDAELEAQQLAQQVAEARKQYEDAKNEAAREAKFRAEAESKQKKIESDIEALAQNEAERRKQVEASAKKFIQEQAERFEAEARAAKQRLDEAKLLTDQEAQKREQAEAARILAEKEAERLSQEIIEVQRQMHEMQQHITHDADGRSFSTVQRVQQSSMQNTGSELTPITQLSGGLSIPPSLLSTGKIEKRSPSFVAAIIIGFVSVFLFGGGGLGIYLYYNWSPTVTSDDPAALAPKPIETIWILIEGGTFTMGRNEVDPQKQPWGDQFPAHSSGYIGSFHIDAYETTIGEYAEFVRERGHKPPSDWPNGAPPEGSVNLPVTNVTLADAKEYAAWVQKDLKPCRLPTESEWEYVARNGSQQTIFPWGDSDPKDLKDARLTGLPGVVGSTKDETVVGGVKDMLGNVSEWTSTPYDLYDKHPAKGQMKFSGKFVIRGLNYQPNSDYFAKPELMITSRNFADEKQPSKLLGFRIACDK